jgi:riboflavin synthase
VGSPARKGAVLQDLLDTSSIYQKGSMFTGIIEETGTVQHLSAASQGGTLKIAGVRIMPGMKPGDSVAVNGVCLTVTECDVGMFSCDLSAETLERTTLRRLIPGLAVNLERPLCAGDRLGGHFVMGHVDAVGTLISKESSGEGSVMFFGFPPELERYLVYKGSVAVDGISLTIASLGQRCFSVAIVPHTLDVTNLRDLRPGASVNLEVDLLGKYLERFFQLGLTGKRSASLTEEYLKEQGF